MKNILIVDDESAFAELLASVLREEGYYATAKLSADDALASCSRLVPDLILSDLKMGNTDGLTLLELLHSNEKLKDVPFVMVTASGDPSLIKKAMQLGATGYITKPIELDELMSAVKQVVPPDD